MNHNFSMNRLMVIGICMVIILVGMLCIDQYAAGAGSAEQTVLFSDDFSGDLSQWTIYSGTWYIDQQELVGAGDEWSDAWIYGGSTDWTDYVLQAKIIFISDRVRLAIRSIEHWWNEYVIDLWQQGGENSNTYQVFRYQDAYPAPLASGTSPVPITNPSIVQVQANGDYLLLYINGVYVDGIKDPSPISNGRIGLGTLWTETARFDDVLVTSLPPVMLLPVEQEGYAEAGEPAEYIVELQNHTGYTDTFNIEVLPGSTWTTTVPIQVGPIADGESTTFTAEVEVPAGAQPGDSDGTTIQATSATSPTLTATAMLSTTVTSGELAYVPMGSSDSLAIIDTDIHTTIGSIDLIPFGCDFPQRARLNPAGTELYVTCSDSYNLLILDTSDNSLITALDRPCGFEQDIAFVQFGAYALLSGHGCGGYYPIDVLDTSTYTIVQSIPIDYDVISMDAHPFLPLAYAAVSQSGWSGAVVVIDTDTFSIQTIIPYANFVWDVQTSPDGQWVYASEYYGNGLAKIDVSTNTIVDTLPGYGKFGLDISPDGSTIYATELWDSVVHIIDANNMDYITTIWVGATTAEPELTCDGSEVYIAREANSIPVIDTQTYSMTYDIPIPGTSSAYGIAICPQYVAQGVFLNPPEQAQAGGRGEDVTYQVRLFNNSGITDTFYLEGVDYVWDTHLSTDQVGPLQDGESASFTVSVTVPADAAWYSTDSVRVLAYSASDPGLNAESLIVTTAYAPAQISVDPSSLESTQDYGEVTTQEMTISNGEGVTLTYNILEGVNLDTVLQLRLDEPAGSTIFNDGSIMNNDGTCSGDSCPMSGVPGYTGNAVLFDGNDDYIQTATNGFPTGYSGRSMAAWVKINSYVSGETFFMGYGNFGSWSETYILMTQGSAFCFSAWSSDVCGPELETGRWYHIAVTSTGDFVTLYLDGVPVATSYLYFNTPGGTQFVIGRIPGYYGDERRLNGLMDDVVVLDYALSADEIMEIYQLGVGGDATWLTVDPASGEVPTNSSDTVQVTFDATNVQPGAHETTLFVNSNDPLQPLVSVPVTMTVEPTGDMGQVTGAVSDAWTGDPIAATVELEGVFSMTADPDFSIWAVEGAYSLTAYAAGYYTATLPVEITAGEVTLQDIALEPALPRLGELPAAISMSLLEGTSGSQELVLTNNGPVALDFALFEIEPLKGLGTENHLAGMKILYDRAHCQGDLYYYSSLTTDLTNAGASIDENFDPFDEDTLDGYDILWINDGGCGWTYDELIVLDNWLAEGGAVLIQSENTPASYSPASIFGIIYHPYQDYLCVEGTTNNVNAHPISEGVDAFSMEWTCNYISGSPVEVILDSWLAYPQVIAAEQGRGKMVVVADNDFVDWLIDYNDNRLLAMNAFQWLAMPVYGDVAWLSETPEQGSIDGHSSLPITLGFNAGGLAPGVYEGILVLEHNDPAQGSPLEIPVTLNVLAEEAAVDITPEEGGQYGSPGETLVYTFTLTNLGNVADSFTLEVSGTWTSTLSTDTTGVLEPGETFIITLSVTVPLEAANGEQDLAQITATSVNDPAVSAGAEATTTAVVAPVEVYWRYLPLACKE